MGKTPIFPYVSLLFDHRNLRKLHGMSIFSDCFPESVGFGRQCSERRSRRNDPIVNFVSKNAVAWGKNKHVEYTFGSVNFSGFMKHDFYGAKFSFFLLDSTCFRELLIFHARYCCSSLINSTFSVKFISFTWVSSISLHTLYLYISTSISIPKNIHIIPYLYIYLYICIQPSATARSTSGQCEPGTVAPTPSTSALENYLEEMGGNHGRPFCGIYGRYNGYYIYIYI